MKAVCCAKSTEFQIFDSQYFFLFHLFTEKPLFTIGSSAITDTDNFSDVSLDRDGASDATITPAEPANGNFYSPLAELDSIGNLQTLMPPTLDTNQDHHQNVDGNLNPISAALAQLPNAASTVLSTFSNIIKGSASQNIDDNLITSSTPMMGQQSIAPLDVTSQNQYGLIYSGQSEPNLPPPSFFSPTDDSLFRKPMSEPVTNNTFRLGGNKKKMYAHIPGLSSNQHAPMVQQGLSPVMPPMPPQPDLSTESINQYQEFQPAPIMNIHEQPKEHVKSNKFSFSSLLPTQLLDKIPSTKNLFGLDTSDSVQQSTFDHSYGQQDFNVMTDYQQPPTSVQSTTSSFTDLHQYSSSPFVNIDQGTSQPPGTSQESAPPVNFFNASQFKTNPFAKISNDTPKIEQSIHPEPLKTENMFTPAAPTIPMKSLLNQNDSPMMRSVPSSQIIAQPIPTMTTTQPSITNEPPKIDAISAETNCPPPTFFNPNEASELFKSRHGDDSRSRNPYSNNRISRGVGLYKTRPENVQPVNTVQPAMLPPMPMTSSQNHDHFFTPPSVQHQAEEIIKPIIFSTPIASQSPVNFFTPPTAPEPQKLPSRLASMSPSLIAGPNVIPINDAQFQAPISLYNQQQIAEPIFAVPSRKKSDLNVPEPIEILPIAQVTTDLHFDKTLPTIQDVSNVSNDDQSQFSSFFDSQPASNSSMIPTIEQAPSAAQSLFPAPIAELISNQETSNNKEQATLNLSEQPAQNQTPNIMNFFQEISSDSQAAAENFFESATVFPQSNPQKASVMSSFFQPEPSAPSLSSFGPEKNELNSISSFFTIGTPSRQSNPESINSNEEIPDNNSQDTYTTLGPSASEPLCEVYDKLESLSVSGTIGSQLSLFATSELDSTIAKRSASESLIPKFLEAQSKATQPSHVTSKTYRPVYRHWFYQSLYWHPFAMSDSLALDEAVTSGKEIILTDGGRFEVNLKERKRSSIYWTSASNAIRRCSWFFKNPNGSESNLLPYDETIADFMEKEYECATLSGNWNHRVIFPESTEFILMKSPSQIEHHKMGQVLAVKRGVDEFIIDDGEEGLVDHLIISVSGFGEKINENGKKRKKFLKTSFYIIEILFSQLMSCAQCAWKRSSNTIVMPSIVAKLVELKFCPYL